MFRRMRAPIPFLSAMAIVLAGCGGESPTQPGNHAPVARAGTDQVVAVGGTARLIGGGSDEDSGDALTYAWTLVTVPAGSSAAIVDSSKATAYFVADSIGLYVARLTVSDRKATGSDEVTITANRVTADHPRVPYAG